MQIVCRTPQPKNNDRDKEGTVLRIKNRAMDLFATTKFKKHNPNSHFQQKYFCQTKILRIKLDKIKKIRFLYFCHFSWKFFAY